MKKAIKTFFTSALSKIGRVWNSELVTAPPMRAEGVDFWKGVGVGTQSKAGLNITHEGSLSLAPVWQAVSVISGDVASIPINVQKVEDEDQFIDTNHPADFLISVQPNEETDAFTFWRRMVLHALIWGNGYGWIIRRTDRDRSPQEMVNLLPDRTTPIRSVITGELFYITQAFIRGKLEEVVIPQKDVFHLKGISIQNEKALDVLDKARNAWGLAAASEEFASRFFDHGAQAGGILEVPPHFTKEARENLEEGFVRKFSDRDNWFKTAILRDGAKFHNITIPADNAQLTEVRQAQVREVARFFNLPGFKLNLEDSQSFRSAEQAQLTYLTGTLRHWLSARKNEAHLKLLTEPQKRRRTHFFVDDTSVIVSVDAKTQRELLEIERRNLIIDANEWRRETGRRPRNEEIADRLLNPNTLKGPVGDNVDDSGGSDNNNDDGTNDDQNLSNQQKDPEISDKAIDKWKSVVKNEVGRTLRRLGHDAERLSKDSSRFLEWVDNNANKNRSIFKESFKGTTDVWEALGYTESSNDLLQKSESEVFNSYLESCREIINRQNKTSNFQKSVKELNNKLPELIDEATNVIVQQIRS